MTSTLFVVTLSPTTITLLNNNELVTTIMLLSSSPSVPGEESSNILSSVSVLKGIISHCRQFENNILLLLYNTLVLYVLTFN